MQHPDASSVAANTVHVPIRFLGQNQGEFGKMKYVSTFLMTLSLGLLSIGCGDTASEQTIDPDGPDPSNMGPSTGAPAGSMGGDAGKGETAVAICLAIIRELSEGECRSCCWPR